MPSNTKAKKSAKKQTKGKAKGKENKNPKKQGKKIKKEKSLNYRIRAIILLGIDILFTVLLFLEGGFVWEFVRSTVYGLFGVPAIFISVMLFYIVVITAKEKEVHKLKTKVFFCIFTIFLFCTTWYIFTGDQYGSYFKELSRHFMKGFEANYLFEHGGGLVGAILGYPMSYGLGNTASAIILILAETVMLLIITGVSLMDIAKASKKPVEAVRHQVQARKVEKGNSVEDTESVREEQFAPHYTDHIDIPIDNKKRRSLGRKKEKSEENNIDDNSLIENNSQQDSILDIIKKANQQFDDEINTSDNSKKEKSQALKEAAKLAKQGISTKDLEDETLAIDNEIKNGEKVHCKYEFPPIQLLKLANNKNGANIRNEMQEKAERLVSTLDSFGVNVTITNICRGPSVTRYELQPAPGVKISKITNLADDIALNLAANGVRIEAPIPGKAAVGIEVPNKNVSMVSMRELIDSDVFRESKSKLTCVLGRDISGEIVTTDLAAMPHLLIAGTTGSGKSVCVNSLLMSILYRATPDEVKFLLIDPKMVEFSKYKGIPHLLVPVVSDAKKAAASLNWAVSEMLQRYKLFSEYDCKDINSFNDLIESNLKFIAEQTLEEGEEPEVMEINGLPVPKEKMFRCVIAIDELADLMMAAPSEVEESICRLAQMARAAGMHLVIATQRPSVNVITGVIKANIPSRISLKVSSNIDSRTILDFGGAEKLIGKGDMLYSPVGAPKPIRVQGCFASDSEIEGVTNYIKKHHKQQYNEEVEEKIKKITVEGIENDSVSSDNDMDLDEKIEEAIKIVIDAGQASTSLVQRRLKVGYARAGRMIDEMETLGVVGPYQGSKPREVLMTYQDWLERKNITTGDESTEE